MEMFSFPIYTTSLLFKLKVLSYFPLEFYPYISLSVVESAKILRGHLEDFQPNADFGIFYDGLNLSLFKREDDSKKIRVFFIDFGKILFELKIPHPEQTEFYRAFKRKSDPKVFHKTIFDLTAGGLKDSLFMAKLGQKVVAFERNPIVYALLKNALENHPIDIPIVYGEGKHLLLKDVLKDVQTKEESSLYAVPDIIYFDPMFDHGSDVIKGRKNKEMDFIHAVTSIPFFQTFHGEMSEDEKFQREWETFQWALSYAKERVVVKRDLRAMPFATPTFQLLGRTTRYDIYETMKL